ncbi:Hypothetical_protein [Hexamita inflata]|uniref:Hypothetical_protein n=1 Tax=Hexamita inflata TaxID=28002 RepID=A0AA86PGH3_9EUKA|nr:Hypothetical protein HINF_LOCUS24473 [Hexamita inflata]CAI9936832.1 Hypothetical protein HINF_LOCUS24477 [Hexamita inflata]
MAINAVHRKIQSRDRPIQLLTVQSVIFQSSDECRWVLEQEIRQQSLRLVKSACLQLVSEISQMLFIFGVVYAPGQGFEQNIYKIEETTIKINRYILTNTHLFSLAKHSNTTSITLYS